jgi:hypothetical protein
LQHFPITSSQLELTEFATDEDKVGSKIPAHPSDQKTHIAPLPEIDAKHTISKSLQVSVLVSMEALLRMDVSVYFASHLRGFYCGTADKKVCSRSRSIFFKELRRTIYKEVQTCSCQS